MSGATTTTAPTSARNECAAAGAITLNAITKTLACMTGKSRFWIA